MLAGSLRPSAPDVRGAHAEAANDLFLDRQVHLVGVGPDEVERWAEDLRRQREARARRIVVERERPDAARQVAIRIGQRVHGRERLPHGEGLVVGRRVPLVAGDAAVEHAGARANRHPAVAARIPRDAQPRRDVVLVGLDDAAADARIAREEQPFGRRRRHLRLRARHERELAVSRIGERELQVVADAEVQRHARVDAVVVLREQAE